MSLIKELASVSPDTHLYLHLYHGRRSVDERLESWGADGPWIGPLRSIRITYAHTVKLTFVDPQQAESFGLRINQPWLNVRNSMMRHGGVWYGEWDVCTGLPTQIEPILPAVGNTIDLDTQLMAAFDAHCEVTDDSLTTF